MRRAATTALFTCVFLFSATSLARAQDAPDVSTGASNEEGPEIAINLAAAGALTFGLTPGVVSAGPSVMAGVRIDDWSFHLMAAFDHSANHRALSSGDEVATRYFAMGPDGCFHFDPGLVCVGLQFGGFMNKRLNLGLDDASQTHFLATADARGGVSIIEGPFLMRILAEVRVPLGHVSVTMDGNEVWSSVPIAGGLRLVVGGRIEL